MIAMSATVVVARHQCSQLVACREGSLSRCSRTRRPGFSVTAALPSRHVQSSAAAATENGAPAVASLLVALREAGTTLALDSGDIELLREHKDRWGVVDATPNMSLLLQAASKPSAYLRKIASEAVRSEPPGRRASSNEVMADDDAECCGVRAPLRGLMSKALDCYNVMLGAELLKMVPGRVSVELDARFAYRTVAMIEQVRCRTTLPAGVTSSRQRKCHDKCKKKAAPTNDFKSSSSSSAVLTAESRQQARHLIELFEKSGVDRNRVFIKVLCDRERRDGAQSMCFK